MQANAIAKNIKKKWDSFSVTGVSSNRSFTANFSQQLYQKLLF